MHPRGRVHDLPAVEPDQQGDHGTAEEGVGFEPCGGSGGSDDGDSDDGDDGAEATSGSARVLVGPIKNIHEVYNY